MLIKNGIDLTGKTIGRLTVVKQASERRNRYIMWECKCSCGNTTIVSSSNLRLEKVKSCGCGRWIDYDEKMKNKTFGNLTPRKKTNKKINGSYLWLCDCICGNSTYVPTRDLNDGNTKSCGCKITNALGKRYEMLEVISYLRKDSNKGHIWLCVCDCGSLTEVSYSMLNYRKSCGCIKYNNELTEDDRQARDFFNHELAEWRDQVYLRDDYTCQLCGEKGGKLNSHHMDSWDKFKEKRFDIDNGITLCVSCHKGFHKEYGYGNNTKEQFKKYESTKPQTV